MAFYIKIDKLSEGEQAAQYAFETDHGRRGVLELDKKSSEVRVVEAMPEDDDLRNFNRAAIKVIRAWREGQLPQTIEWAS